ncbi:transposase family protein [Gemmata sp. JC673]|uniref:Transposase family protein n=1 Tax=Gemmata algarum TaxID=2975278 RepID=A0ABU5F7R6_9BACT|nr:transposase family protein [Gemmata algarum]MDY3562378.1 transposase family protein [Gemmata algarum]
MAVIVDSSEQRPQRADDSCQKAAHTLKSQMAVDEASGRIVHVSESVPGRWADIKRLDRSGLLNRLPGGVGACGSGAHRDSGPAPAGCAPGANTVGRTAPADRKYNRAFRRHRIGIEHAIGRLRRFRSLSHVNRHRRHGHGHGLRVRAVAGLVNRMLDHRAKAA